MGQPMKVFFYDFFFGVCYLQEPFIYGIDIVAVERVADLLETKSECAAAATGCKNDPGAIGANLVGVDDLVGAGVFEEPVLVNSRGVGESIGPDNGLIRLNRH